MEARVSFWRQICLALAMVLAGYCAVSCAQEETKQKEETPAAAAKEETVPSTESPGTESPAPGAPDKDVPAEASPKTGTPEKAVPEAPAAALPAGDGLDIYVLRNKAGELVKMPGWKLEDFRKAWERERLAAPTNPPSYSIDALLVTGTAEEGGANLEAHLKIRVRETGWVKVPLYFQGAALLAEPVYQGPGEHVVMSGTAEEGIVCWLSGKDPKPHELKLKLRGAITSTGDENRLAMTFARATESSLTLAVPMSPIDATSGDAQQAIVATKTIDANQSEIRVLGLGGPMQIHWHRADDKKDQGAQLEASGEIAVRVEGQNRISSDLRLKVRSFTGSLETFRVRMPAGMRYQGGATTGYSVRVVTNPQPENTPGVVPRQIVEVKLEKAATGIAEVQLTAVLTPESQGADFALEPASFEVIEAVRHRGSIDFFVEGNWLLDWQEDAATRRVAVSAEAVSGRAARFEYFRQPCGLQLRVSPEPTRISVEPLYIAYVDAAQVRLEATYKFRLRGARVGQLSLDLRGWRFDRITPETAVDSSLVNLGENDQLLIPLRLAAASGDVEIKLEAHRDIIPGSPTIELTVPRPKADMVTPGPLVIVPADNIDLTPDLAASRGFTADSLPVGLKLPQRQQSPLVYRDSSTKDLPRMVSGFQIRSRRTTVAAAAKVQFERQLIRVQQRLNYRISHEPQRVFSLLVPLGFDVEQSELRVMLGSEVLPIVNSNVEPAEAGNFRTRIRFSTPTEQLGPCEFVLQYNQPFSQPKDGKTLVASVPLLSPPAEEVQGTLGQTIQVSWPSGLLINPAQDDAKEKSPWNLETINRQELRATSSRLVGQSNWSVSLDPSQRSGLTQIDRAWIQSWMTQQGLVQRTCWKLKTSSKELLIAIPSNADPNKTEVVLEGRAVLDALREGTNLRVAIPSNLDNRVFHLEIWHHSPQAKVEQNWVTKTMVSAPSIVDSVGAYPSIWQISTGSRDPIVDWPSAFQLRSGPSLLGLVPAAEGDFSQPRLQAWIGNCTPLETWPAAQAYTFYSFGPLESLVLTRVDYRWLLWGGSALLVGFSLLVSKVAVLRRPATLLLLALLLVAGTLSAPQLSGILLQAAGLGLLVALAVAAWHWRTSLVTKPRETVTATSASKVIDARESSAPSKNSVPPPAALIPPSDSAHLEKIKPSSTATAALLPMEQQP